MQSFQKHVLGSSATNFVHVAKIAHLDTLSRRAKSPGDKTCYKSTSRVKVYLGMSGLRCKRGIGGGEEGDNGGGWGGDTRATDIPRARD